MGSKVFLSFVLLAKVDSLYKPVKVFQFSSVSAKWEL